MENWANVDHTDFYEFDSTNMADDSDDTDDIIDILNWSTGADPSTGYTVGGEDEDRFVFVLQPSETSRVSTAGAGAQPAPSGPVFDAVPRATSHSTAAALG